MIFIKLYRAFKVFIFIIIALTIVFVVNSSFEIVFVNKRFEDFKTRGVLIEELSSEYSKYYSVKKQYDYEDLSRNIVDFDKKLLGDKADIIITNRNPMRDVPSLDFPMKFLAHNFFIGHASINDNDGELYEVFGNSGDNDGVGKNTNNWLKNINPSDEIDEYPILVGLRIKNTTEEQRNQMLEYADMQSQSGKGYNYTFLFNRANSFYCTDLVSRSIAHAGINVNYDYLATTGNDMILSSNVYIIYYREVKYIDGKKYEHIYFLDKE